MVIIIIIAQGLLHNPVHIQSKGESQVIMELMQAFKGIVTSVTFCRQAFNYLDNSLCPCISFLWLL